MMQILRIFPPSPASASVTSIAPAPKSSPARRGDEDGRYDFFSFTADGRGVVHSWISSLEDARTLTQGLTFSACRGGSHFSTEKIVPASLSFYAATPHRPDDRSRRDTGSPSEGHPGPLGSLDARDWPTRALTRTRTGQCHSAYIATSLFISGTGHRAH